MHKVYYVYILTNYTNTTFYIGVTNNLQRRVYEHKNKLLRSFTNKYHLKKLVYYEETNDIYIALNREKQLKRWKRAWKVQLIRESNPTFQDLTPE